MAWRHVLYFIIYFKLQVWSCMNIVKLYDESSPYMLRRTHHRWITTEISRINVSDKVQMAIRLQRHYVYAYLGSVWLGLPQMYIGLRKYLFRTITNSAVSVELCLACRRNLWVWGWRKSVCVWFLFIHSPCHEFLVFAVKLTVRCQLCFALISCAASWRPFPWVLKNLENVDWCKKEFIK
jgi:hypothetical protein